MSSKEEEVEIVEQHTDPNSKASPTDDDLFVIDQVGANSKSSPNDDDLFIIDQAGDKQICTDAKQGSESVKSNAPDSEIPEEKPVLEAVDGLFRLDTTPEVSKAKTLGPRYRRVISVLMLDALTVFNHL